MILRDRDLVSIQEARELAARAAEAQQRFATFSQPEVDAVVDACAAAANVAAEPLARAAVEETGFGNVPDKIQKNRFGAVDVFKRIRGMKTVGVIHEDKEKGIVELATPVGVVAAIIPSTNPTSTTIYKTLISIKARNAIVMSPHPSAVKCIRAATDVLSRAALQAGAPDGLISCMEHATLQGTQELWKHREVGVILATGGTGLVRAAYASGKPAYGVGPGNVPAYIERTANVRKAVADIIAGKTFDYGTICSSEQAIVCDEQIRDLVIEECRRQGAYFLNEDEIKKVGGLVFKHGSHTPNPHIVGKPATTIAEMAGIQVPQQTRVLIARLTGVGREIPLSAEKLSPILAFYSVPNTPAGIELCTKLLHFGGSGHTASVHTQNESVAREYGSKVPAFRVCVNTASVHGSIGYSTNLFPAMTLGCGALGGNITSDNIGPQHLMNIKRVAWEARPIEHRTVPADRRMFADAGAEQASQPVQSESAAASAATAKSSAPVSVAPDTSHLKPSGAPSLPDRATVARAVEHVMQHLGIPRGAAAASAGAGLIPRSAPDLPKAEDARLMASPTSPAAAPEVKSGVLPSPTAEIVSRVFSQKASVSSPTPPVAVPPSTPTPESRIPPPEPKVVDFVSEMDVRQAIHKGQKIFIGPKTILTPSARDLASGQDVIVEIKEKT